MGRMDNNGDDPAPEHEPSLKIRQSFKSEKINAAWRQLTRTPQFQPVDQSLSLVFPNHVGYRRS
jgi:hypothetical protein